MGEVGDIISHAEFMMWKYDVLSSLTMDQESQTLKEWMKQEIVIVVILLQLEQIATVTASTNPPNYCIQR